MLGKMYFFNVGNFFNIICFFNVNGFINSSLVLPATTTYAQTVSPLDRPIGWASEAGGTTGGGNAAPVIVTSASELQNLVKDNTPRVIYVQGNIGGNYTAGSNKTIIGLPGATTGSWTFKGSSNVILRNLKIRGNGADGDAVTVTDYSIIFGLTTLIWPTQPTKISA